MMKHKNNWWIFALTSLSMFWMSLNSLYPSEDVSDYESQELSNWGTRIEEFTGRRNVKYYELAIYSDRGSRLFIRSPHRDIVARIRSNLHHGQDLTIHHLTKDEDSRGNRVVNIMQNGNTIYDINDVVNKQNKVEYLIMLFGLIYFSIGAFLFYLRRANNKIKTTQKAHG